MPLAPEITVCRHCGRDIHYVGQFVNAWVHTVTKSIWCDLSATVRAAPR